MLEYIFKINHNILRNHCLEGRSRNRRGRLRMISILIKLFLIFFQLVVINETGSRNRRMTSPFPKRRFAPHWCAAAALASLIFLVSGFFARDTAGVETAEPPIRSAAEIDYPPFSLVDGNGRADGFSVELLRAALSAMGREVTFRTGPWAKVRSWLQRGEVQALPLAGRSPERGPLIDFTFPYMTLHGSIVVRKGTSGIWDMDDLADRQVAVMKGDNAEAFLRRKYRGIDIRTTPTFEQALRELSEGRHDAVFIQRPVALHLIREGGMTHLKVVNRPIEEFRQDFCFAVKEGDRETLALLKKGLSLVMADGTYRHLHAKWFAAMKLPAHRRIVVGGDHNFPPFEYLDEHGRPAGYSVDLTRAIAQEIGLDIEIRLGPWAKIREDLAEGEIDVIQGMFYSPERDLTFDFTPSHAVNHYVGVVRKGDGLPPKTVEELSQKRIVVQQGDIMHDFAMENGLKQVSAVEAQEDALRELAEGKHDCALVSRLAALYWIDRYDWKNLVVGTHSFLSPEYCFAVPNNQKALLAQFSEGLNILEDTREYRRIQEKWFGVYQSPSPTVAGIMRFVGLIAVPLLFVLCGVFLWSWSLRKQVATHTEALRKSEEFQRAMIACSPVALYSIDPDGRVLTWNPSAERIFGWSAADVIGGPLPIVPEHKHEEFARLRKQGIAGRHFIGKEVVRMKKDGTCFDGSLSAAPIRDAKNRIIGIMSAMEDITERKRAEAALRESEERLQAILESNANPIVVYDVEGCPHYLNPAFFRIFGWTLAELEGRRIPFVPEDQKEITASKIAEIFATEAPVKFVSQRLTKKGDVLDVVVSAAIVRGAEGQGIGMVVNLTDITEQRKLETQLRQAQRMESVGRLAGGVAHDYNNMLSVILGYSEMALDRIDPEDPLKGDLEEILYAARRSADITRQLLAFSRQQSISPKMFDLSAAVESILKMLRRLIGEDIDLLWKPDKVQCQVKMDPTQLDQILANLCVNARDAIAGTGKITIETGHVVFDQAYCAEHAGFAPGGYALLAVSDDGIGMTRETLSHLFEPFFTTKNKREGTGLGLATVYGIVKQNQGCINVYSEPDKGTTFKIYLPRHGVEEQEKIKEPMAPIPSKHGETVLLVEDEASILKMGKALLENLGYAVLASANPIEALTLARKHFDKIHLLVTDVVMPDMNGRELADRLQRIFPNLKILFMSGYTANMIAHQGVLDEGVNFIQKPFSNQDLAAKVREALEG